MRLLTILLVPAALAFAPSATLAAPAPPSGQAPDEVRTAIETTPAYHRGYRHYRRYYYRRYDYPRYRYRTYPRYRYRPYGYYYGPRCYWSRYYHRRICR